jgi:hypothetical protein
MGKINWEAERKELMQLSAIITSRALAFIDVNEILSGGNVYLPDVSKILASEFEFQKVPTKAEELNLGDGIEFKLGRNKSVVIERIAIFYGLVLLETKATTEVSKETLLEIFRTLFSKMNISFSEELIKRWAFISFLTFYTDFPLLAQYSDPLKSLAEKTTNAVSRIFDEDLKYEPLEIKIGHEPTLRKNDIASFTIQHRLGARFSENKYYSEAPLPTDLHLQLLQEFERDVLEQQTLPKRGKKLARS